MVVFLSHPPKRRGRTDGAGRPKAGGAHPEGRMTGGANEKTPAARPTRRDPGLLQRRPARPQA